MVCGQFHLVQIEIYELGMDYFRVENETRDEWSRKQTSSGKKLTAHFISKSSITSSLSYTRLNQFHTSTSANAKVLLQAIQIHRF